MGDHVCACKMCDPSLAPFGPRQGEHHVGVRFTETRDWRCEVFLDGQPLPYCYELLAGEHGTAWVYRGPKRHLCCRSLNGSAACAEIIHGNLSVRRTGTRPPLDVPTPN